MKRNIFDTWFARYAGLSRQAPMVVKYLATNRDLVLDEKDLSSVLSQKSILRTPLSRLFDRIVETDKLSAFSTIFIHKSGESIPELLTATNISLDLKIIPEASSLKTMLEYWNKSVVNLSNVLKYDRSASEFRVSDIETLHKQYLRGMFAMSYHDQPGRWLTPYLAEYVVRSYSMTISGLIARYYNLSISEELMVKAILAFYMCQMLDDDDGDSAEPALFAKCTFLGTRAVQDAAIVAMAEHHDMSEPLDILIVCDLLSKTGPDRMVKFDHTAFATLTDNLGGDPVVTKIAMEYPPYWLYLLVSALSGNKLALRYQLDTTKLQQEGRSKFINELTVSSSLMEHVDRDHRRR